MPTHSVDEARLIRLEEKLAYQDKLIDELNEVVTSLNRDNAELTRRLEVLERAYRELAAPREMPNEKPPHY